MIKPTIDIDKINSVLKHDDIWPRIADKRQKKGDFIPPTEGITYLFEEGVLFILHPNGDDLQIHANVVPEFRSKANQAAREALRYGFVELGYNKIVAKIPEKYGNVYGFALKFMKDVGFIDGEHLLELRAEEWDL
jgi:hypothetical protein